MLSRLPTTVPTPRCIPTTRSQLCKLEAQVEALQREKRALEGRAAQQGRDARLAAEAAKVRGRDRVRGEVGSKQDGPLALSAALSL